MRKPVSVSLVLAVSVLSMPVGAIAAPGQHGQTGSITGTAKSSKGETLRSYTVRVRNVNTGSLQATTTANQAGSFTFPGLTPANYVVEIVAPNGQVVGLSSAVSVAAGSTMTVTVTATTAGAIAAAGAGGFSLLGLGTTASVAVVSAAGVATVVGVVAAKKTASPSR